MKSKIEKLEEFNWFEGRDSLTIALDNTIIKKLNEIIDYLNSQDKEEELTDKKKAIDKGVDRKDTPEEWKEVNKDIWYTVGGKKYVSINGEEYVRTSDI